MSPDFGGANVKLQPDSTRPPARTPTFCQLESALRRAGLQPPSGARYWTRKRIRSVALRLRPGIEPRMPMVFGLAAVSHTLTVAHRSLDPCAAAAAGTSPSRTSVRRRLRMVRPLNKPTGHGVAPCDGSCPRP